MKNASKRQYILTLIVSFVAIVVLSLCTIMTFYKKSVNDTLALAAETVKQEQEYMNLYLNRAVDAVEVTKITVEHMMREGRPEQDILNFLTNESDYYLQDIDAAFTGVYGFINGEYLDCSSGAGMVQGSSGGRRPANPGPAVHRCADR